MAHHGWGGRPPASEAEARQRIVEATAGCLDRHGVAKTTLSDVAAELGVTRQTVYRHFARISDIIAEVAARGADAFGDRLLAHLRDVTDPVEAVIEGMVFCVRTIPADPRVSLLLQLGDSDAFGRGATTGSTPDYGARLLRRFAVEWAAACSPPSSSTPATRRRTRISSGPCSTAGWRRPFGNQPTENRRAVNDKFSTDGYPGVFFLGAGRPAVSGSTLG